MQRFLRFAILAALALVPGTAFAAAPVDPGLLAGMKARSIGPAGMSGRVAAIAAVESNPEHRLRGERQRRRLEISQRRPHLEAGVRRPARGLDRRRGHLPGQSRTSSGWARARAIPATASRWARASIARSTAAGPGSTWASRRRSASTASCSIPNNPTWPGSRPWASSWGENPERGVFKTESTAARPGARCFTWIERTGAADLVMDPRQSQQAVRLDVGATGAGPGSSVRADRAPGLYVTWTAGETWKRITEDGRPAQGGPGADRHRHLALEPGHRLRTGRGREERRWCARTTAAGPGRRSTSDQRTAERPFYFADIRVDPEWPNRLYNLTARLTVSEDGGKTLRTCSAGSREIHGDYHAMWIDPHEPEPHRDRATTAAGDQPRPGRDLAVRQHLPLAQFYHVAVDMEQPVQRLRRPAGQRLLARPEPVWAGRRHPQLRLGGRWAAATASTPGPTREDSMTGYSMSQGGELVRWDLRSREIEARSSRRSPPDGLEPLRFNWNAGLAHRSVRAGHASTSAASTSTNRRTAGRPGR